MKIQNHITSREFLHIILLENKVHCVLGGWCVVGVLSESTVSSIARPGSDHVLRSCNRLRCACHTSHHHRSNRQGGR